MAVVGGAVDELPPIERGERRQARQPPCAQQHQEAQRKGLASPAAKVELVHASKTVQQDTGADEQRPFDHPVPRHVHRQACQGRGFQQAQADEHQADVAYGREGEQALEVPLSEAEDPAAQCARQPMAMRTKRTASLSTPSNGAKITEYRRAMA